MSGGSNGLVEGRVNGDEGGAAGPFGIGQTPGVHAGEGNGTGEPRVFGPQNLQQIIIIKNKCETQNVIKMYRTTRGGRVRFARAPPRVGCTFFPTPQVEVARF